MMKLEEWTNAGYKRFKLKTHLLNRNADFGLQKRFSDDKGTRYFITVYVYDHGQYKFGSFDSEHGFMPTAQFDMRDSKPFFNVEMNGTFTIQECEDWFEKLFVFFGEPYYELRE